MTELYRFFAGATGDERLYDQADLARAFAMLTQDGVIRHYQGELGVTVTSPMTRAVEVLTGAAWVQGYPYENTGQITLPIAAADPTSPRIDRVMLRLDEFVNRDIRVRIAQGTPAATPVPPAPIRTGGIYELVLANVTVPANAATISAANINTSPRQDRTLCGYAGSIFMPTTMIEPEGPLAMGNQRITGLAAGSAATDAATVGQITGGGGGGSSSSVPAGCMMYWAGNTGMIPSGWLKCEGQYVNMADYPALYSAIGSNFGALVGQTFKLPDGRSNVIGVYDSRYPEWQPIGSIHGQMAHTATSTGTQNLTQWLVTSALIIKY